MRNPVDDRSLLRRRCSRRSVNRSSAILPLISPAASLRSQLMQPRPPQPVTTRSASQAAVDGCMAAAEYGETHDRAALCVPPAPPSPPVPPCPPRPPALPPPQHTQARAHTQCSCAVRSLQRRTAIPMLLCNSVPQPAALAGRWWGWRCWNAYGQARQRRCADGRRVQYAVQCNHNSQTLGAASNIHLATYNLQRATSNLQHATYNVHFAPCNLQHAIHSTREASCRMQRAHMQQVRPRSGGVPSKQRTVDMAHTCLVRNNILHLTQRHNKHHRPINTIETMWACRSNPLLLPNRYHIGTGTGLT